MSLSPAASPPPERDLLLHQRLIERDPTAPDDFADAFLEPLTAWLTEHNGATHPDLVSEAAEEAILAVIRNPASYRPQGSPLESYLRMSAQADLRNLLRRETTRRGRHERWEAVELSDDDGKYMGKEDDPSLGLMIEEELAMLPEGVPESVREGLTEIEARVLQLMLRGEKNTAVYAAACEIEDLPPEEQRRFVYRIKNRLKKRIERQGQA